MLDRLIEVGKTYSGKFTTEYSYGTEYGIEGSLESEYLQWLSKLGVYSEAKLKLKYPDMTNQIIGYVKNKTKMLDDYNIIIGYLESVKELEG